jgi:predicted HTH domain antitoxin
LTLVPQLPYIVNEAMSILLEIPDSVAQSLHLPEKEVQARLRTELAAALYAQGILSFGKAAELAGASRFAFADVLSLRGIARHYTEEELIDDLTYAGRQ